MQRQVTFIEAIRKAILENYCNFSGRASRSEYWWYALFTLLLGSVLSVIFGDGSVAYIISGVVSIALFLPGLGLAVRRLHDTGKCGWWVLLSLIPLVGLVILVIWMCQPSTPADNQYGPEPNMI